MLLELCETSLVLMGVVRNCLLDNTYCIPMHTYHLLYFTRVYIIIRIYVRLFVIKLARLRVFLTTTINLTFFFKSSVLPVYTVECFPFTVERLRFLLLLFWCVRLCLLFFYVCALFPISVVFLVLLLF